MKCFWCYKQKKPTNSINSSAPPTIESGMEVSTETVASGKQSSWLTSSSSSPSIPGIYEERLRNLKEFDLSELKTATNNFSRLLKIGEGGFGSVYKGFLLPTKPKDRKTVVAIKMLNHNSQQGHKEWLAEVKILSVLEHPNLVKLIGYCAVDGERGIQRLLVYEYMTNKSLEHHLFNKPSSVFPPLPWITRLQIALGAAKGLDYLHHGFEAQIIYRDYKPSNVLLDEHLMPKLSDFGLAREGPFGDRTHVTTAVVGTRGYAAPEYVETGHLTSKSDVWSFGVVLFEIITGRASIEPNRPKTEQKLLEWIKKFPVGTKRFHMILDPRLRNPCSIDSVRMVATLANRCLLKNPKDRPTMTAVIDSLENAIIQEQACHTDPKLQQPKKEEEKKEEEEKEEEEKEEDVGITESFKRRMVLLAKMGDKHNRRKGKFQTMHVSI